MLSIIMLALFFIGCGNSNTTNTKKVEPTKTPTPVATPTPTPSPSAKPDTANAIAKTPEEFIKLFVAAHESDNKEETKKYVTDAAMKKLRFGMGPSEDLRFQGCGEDNGIITCAYTYGGGSVSYTLKKDPTTGYKVTDVEETAD